MESENFIPMFKENGTSQFYFSNETWIECDEEKIAALWTVWIVSINTHRFQDDNGFIVFGNYKLT